MTCGSLLTVPLGVAHTSWKRWDDLQPTPVSRYDHGGFDLGPHFVVEPFDGVLAARAIIDRSSWHEVVAALGDGFVRASLVRCRVVAKDWSATAFIGSRGATAAHGCVVGLKRPVTGVVAILDAPPIAPTEDTWVWPVAPGLRPGPELGAVAPHRRLLHWPIHMLGIDWSGLPEHPPELRTHCDSRGALRRQRRVRKGGVQAEKQELFTRLIAQGISNSEACRMVGINRKTGTRWRYGRTVRNTSGELVQYPPVKIAVIGPRSTRYLSEQERVVIADLLTRGKSIRAIAAEIGRSASTVSREIKRNGDPGGRYRPHHAEHTARTRAARPRQRRITRDAVLRDAVADLLQKRWSPEQVAHELHVLFAGQPLRCLCTESISQAIYDPAVQVTRPARASSSPSAPARRSAARPADGDAHDRTSGPSRRWTGCKAATGRAT